jgi:hypothetical protein
MTATMKPASNNPDRKFAVLFAATILAARKLSELEAQGITRPCPAREIDHHRRDQQG